MKLFKTNKFESLLLIEESDIHDNLLNKLRGQHVDFVIAPIELKDNELFIKQVQANISMLDYTWGKLLYYVL